MSIFINSGKNIRFSSLLPLSLGVTLHGIVCSAEQTARKLRLFYCLAALLFVAGPLIAQVSLREQALLMQGDRSYKEGKTELALTEYESVVSLNANNVKANYMAGLCYLASSRRERSLNYFLRAYDLNPSYFIPGLTLSPNLLPDLTYLCGYALQLANNIDRAEENYRFLKKALFTKQPDSPAEQDKHNAALNLIDRRLYECASAREMTAAPITLRLSCPDSLNSIFADCGPVLNRNKKLLYFSSNRPQQGAQPDEVQLNSDIYVAGYRTDSSFTAPEEIIELNTKEDELCLDISEDGIHMLILKPDNRGDFFLSKLKNGRWGHPKTSGDPLNSPQRESGACFTPDGRTIIFSSDRPGGQGGLDLWMYSSVGDNNAVLPVNLGPKINSNLNEDFPALSTDGKTLYFSSEGHQGMGGYDVFSSKARLDSLQFDTPRNLGYPFNSPDNDVWYRPGTDSVSGYSVRIKDGCRGEYDIFKVTFAKSSPFTNPADDSLAREQIAQARLKKRLTDIGNTIPTGKEAANEEEMNRSQLYASGTEKRRAEALALLNNKNKPGKKTGKTTAPFRAGAGIAQNDAKVVPPAGFAAVLPKPKLNEPIADTSAVLAYNGKPTAKQSATKQAAYIGNPVESNKPAAKPVTGAAALTRQPESPKATPDSKKSDETTPEKVPALANQAAAAGTGSNGTIAENNKPALTAANNGSVNSVQPAEEKTVATAATAIPETKAPQSAINKPIGVTEAVLARKNPKPADLTKAEKNDKEVPENAVLSTTKISSGNAVSGTGAVKPLKNGPVSIAINVTNAATGALLPAVLSFTDKATGRKYSAQAEGAGVYKASFKFSKPAELLLSVSAKGYNFRYIPLLIPAAGNNGATPIERVVELERIKLNKALILRNVYFNFGEFTLKKESEDELGTLQKFLSANPDIIIEIAGHTDFSGSPARNLELSRKRAETVSAWLVQRGIHPSRLRPKGYGQTKPLASNDDEAEGRELNRRTEFIVLGKKAD